MFIEIGVENYLESNTRYLLIKRNWKGLLIEKSQEDVEFIKKDSIYWKHDLTVVRDADELSFADIEKQIIALGEKAKTGQLSIEELQGGTFTITNGGIYGSCLNTCHSRYVIRASCSA